MTENELTLFVSSDELRTQEKSTDASEINDFTCSLHGSVKANSNGDDEVHLRVEYEPTDKSLVYKFRVFVDFSAHHRTKRSVKRCRHDLEDEDQHKNSLSANIALGRITYYNFSAVIKFKVSECYPKLPSFELKDKNLSNFKLIVGDTDFYTGKDILAHNSPQIYTLLYGGKSPFDGTEVAGDEELSGLVIDDVAPKKFHKFLCMMLGYKTFSIKNDEFIDFVKLSHKFSSAQMLQECEIAYFKMKSLTREKHHLAAENWDKVKIFLEKLDEKLKNVKLMEAASKKYIRFELRLKNVVSTIEIDDVQFKARCNFDKKSNYRKLEIECTYKDASNLWKHSVTIIYRNRFGKKQKVPLTFSASNPTCDIVIPYVAHVGMKLDSSWGTYKNIEHNFDEHIDNLTDVVLLVDERRFHVNKQILANASTYFRAMFYRGFREKGQSEIKLEKVDGSMHEFLQHVYCPKRAVEECMLEDLLKMARYYDAPAIRNKCVQFMQKSTDDKYMRKVELLKRKCMKEFNPIHEKVARFESLVCMEGIEELDEKTKYVLSGKVAELKSELMSW